MDEKKLQEQLDDLKRNVTEAATKEATDRAKDEIKKAIDEVKQSIRDGEKVKPEDLKTINEGIKQITDWKKDKDEADRENQRALDNLIATVKEINKNTTPKTSRSFGEVFAEEVAKEENFAKIKEVRKGKPFILSLKAAGNMTLGANLTGDSVATYSQMQSLVPAQRNNFRDFMRTVNSDTGLYIHYDESGGEGSVEEQTEGSAKSQLDFDFTEVKTVNKYVSGFTRFSKQMSRSLPFFQQTLPALLLRKFYNEENSYFFTTVSGAATGSTTTSETDDVKQIIDYIANQHQANFIASVGLVSHTQLARINKLLYTNGWNQPGGGVISQPDGSVIIGGVRIVPASWVTDDKILIVDSDYLERVEVEGVRVEFFEQDSDNVQKNLITARIECYEEVNLMKASSAIYADFGN